ncbi:hypothetical protein Vretimale_4376 [Volvox reticuliferus]|uniref:Protein kinase domain-containing protein n=1 Tax=Volvox reticuliferus TaxID=1737510 RepID=A0A8J4G483_9CHLO|nr:hypothetical protein Vretifemale_2968 [Volvox reticuliferus]GIL99110.1 hypothetical protein Vretimale_4376 [Volvox reticuliferus]
MLRAAHYKADSVDGPGAGKSPPKHRSGGILDLALTAADKYALSLLPTALKGTGLASVDGPATDYRAAPQHSTNGIPPAFKMQRPAGLHNSAAPPQEAQLQPGVAGVATSWDASLKEILAALEPETRTLKPAKLRDYKYPNQNHGMPTNTVVHSPRRELDEALITLPGGTRRNKSSVPAYTNAYTKGLSRQSRRPEAQAPVHSGVAQSLDVPYDLVPSVKLAWVGPGSGTYSTTGFGGSPKKYTSQLVGRVSPHYAGTPSLQQSMSSPAGNQDPLHLPEIANGSNHSGAHQQGNKISSHLLPSFQSWSHAATPSTAGQSRRALPYVSTNTPSLAKPLTVQYHPVLKSPSLGAGAGVQYAQPAATPALAMGSRGTLQRPATDHGSSSQHAGGGVGSGEQTRLYPRTAYGGQPHRLPHTPPEVAAEVARLRHAQELNGVINGVRSDLMQASAPRLDAPVKSKFLQMYEDPNRPLAKLNPKQFLGDVAPTSQHYRRHRPPVASADKPQVSADGRPPSATPSSSTRSLMYERRLHPLSSDAQIGEDTIACDSDDTVASSSDGPDADTLLNVHLQPSELPDRGMPDDDGMQSEQPGMGLEAEAVSPIQSTPRSSLIEREDTVLSVGELGGLPDNGGSLGALAGDEAGSSEGARAADQPGGDDKAPLEVIGQEEASSDAAPLEAGSRRLSGPTLEGEPEQDPARKVPERTGSGQQPAGGSEPQQLHSTVIGGTAPATEQFPDGQASAQAQSLQDGTELQRDDQLPRSNSVPHVVGDCKEVSSVAPESTPGVDQLDAAQCAAAAEPTGTARQDNERNKLQSENVVRPVRTSGAEDAAAPAEEAADQDSSSRETVALDCADSARRQAAAHRTEGDLSDAAPHATDQPATSFEGAAVGIKESVSAEAPDTANTPPAWQMSVAPGLTEMNASGAASCAPATSVVDFAHAAAAPPGTVQGARFADADPARFGEPLPTKADSTSTPASDATPSYNLPPGVTPEMARASAICIQSHARGYHARRRIAAMRKEREASLAAQAEAPSSPFLPLHKQSAYELPTGVTPEMARTAVVRIQSHARGYFARRHAAELRRGREAGEAALVTAVTAIAARKLEGYELKAGITVEMAEAAAIRVQAHMRGHLARRRVKHMRDEISPAAEPAGAFAPGLTSVTVEVADGERAACSIAGDGQGQPGQRTPEEDATRELGETVSSCLVAEETGPPPAPSVPVEFTIDALKAALADEEEEEEQQQVDADAASLRPEDGAAQEPSLLDMADPAVIAAAAAAAAAAKGAIRLLDDGEYGLDGLTDTIAGADQAEEASMARLAANSARTSAMFQGAGAEMRFSDDEASALELMDNLDGLLQGDDEAAAAAAAVAAATAPADGELVSISADGVSEPQALGVNSSGGPAPNPMDLTEPGGVRVLAGKYEVQHVVGEGAYGMVMKCKVRGTEPVQWVAIKEFKIDDNDPDAEDVKRTSLREVAVLEALQHPHVVGFVDKFMVGDRLFIVMEFLPCNLLELLEAQPGGMDRDAVRLIMFQLCSAIAFIHSKGMVYRDIKPENLLVDEHGTVKLCDFGFARYLPSGPSSHLTDYVATRWYRAPELLLGPPYRDALGKHVQYMYGPPVDMWAVGCLMGELLDGEPLFAGDSDLDQLYRVQQILGPMAPSHQYMFYANPHNTGIVFNIKQPMTLAARYRGKVSEVELNFMSGLLEMDPDKRLSGEQCLQHPYLVDLAAAANALPAPSLTASDTPTGTNLSTEDGGSACVTARDGKTPSLSAAGGTGDEPSNSGEAASDMRGLFGSTSLVARSSESREGLGSRGLEKAGSLTRAAGSLTRGGRSLSRGSVSPVMTHPVSVSPVPGSVPQRGASKLHASDNGQVVIVEGVEEDEAEGRGAVRGMAAVKSVSALAEVAGAVSEIEPVEEL